MNDTNSTGQPAASPGLAEATGSVQGFWRSARGENLAVYARTFASLAGAACGQRWEVRAA